MVSVGGHRVSPEVRLSWAPWAGLGAGGGGRSPGMRSKVPPTEGFSWVPGARAAGRVQGGGGLAWPLVEVRVCTQPSP